MKIAYLAELDAHQSSGVLNKITAQVRILTKLGVEVKLFLISKPPGNNKSYASILNGTNSWIYHSYLANIVTRLSGKKQNYLNKMFTALTVRKRIKEYNPDVIYYRFGIWFPGQLTRFANKPVVVELNSNDLEEYKSYDKLTFYLHQSTRDRLLERADGFCSVTEEIGKIIPPKNKPGVVVSNGMVIPAVKNKRNTENDRTQLVFAGASDCRWHGLDKIVHLARLLPGYDFHIVGRTGIENKERINNIIVHDFLEPNELSQFYSEMDLAIGTLALHRKNMIEASPLKVRDYVAHGLPVIVGYKDTDLDGKPFILNVGNYEDNVIDNTRKISDFIDFWKNRDIEVDLSCIDLYGKEKQRLCFFKELTK